MDISHLKRTDTTNRCVSVEGDIEGGCVNTPNDVEGEALIVGE